ncbi:hypothetical protein [Kitasatospora indigofera]|uniref:hypothetical protein n=1 Tax=Kitasatospora indigofera TaxID=67307 RepID=UPI0036C2A5AC
MHLLKRIAGTAAAALTLAAGGLVLAPAASAATSQQCSFIDGGILCTSWSSDTSRWGASFLNQSRKTKHIRFDLRCHNIRGWLNDVYDQGRFDVTPGQVRTYSWPKGANGDYTRDCTAWIVDYDSGQYYGKIVP